MRGLKIVDTKILSYQIYHNYFRPHESLKGKTPSEVCGIQIHDVNKWKTRNCNWRRIQIEDRYWEWFKESRKNM